MGLKVNVPTKHKATLKMFNALNSYLFEQEYEDLKNLSTSDKETLKAALKVLASIIKKDKKNV